VIERQVEIVNSFGLHARPAAQFVKLAGGFASDISVTKGDMTINGKSIMGVMLLEAECGCTITIRATGDDAAAAAEALATLVQKGFDET
jgi:phosphocarrier protein